MNSDSRSPQSAVSRSLSLRSPESNPAIELTLRHELPSDLGPSVTLAAYRVVQEGLINALRHAQATRIEINLESRIDEGHAEHFPEPPAEPGPQRMIVTITDDGVGLPAGWSRPGHFGLRGLTERIEHLGGHFNIRNREPHGVCLIAEIPLVTVKAPTAVTP
jgi:two-component system sensor histidine kinase UhpB